MSSEPVKRDLPEWIRVISIFVVTFALMVVVAGLFGAQVDWADNPKNPPEFYNRP